MSGQRPTARPSPTPGLAPTGIPAPAAGARCGVWLGLALAWAFAQCGLAAASAPYLTPGEPGALFRGRTEATAPDPTAWRALAFDDSAWERVRFPIFRGLPLVGTELADMAGQYTSVCVRRAFAVDDPSEVVQLELGAACAGGYVAWINGQEVQRANVPDGELPVTARALTDIPSPVPFVAHEFRPWPGLLVAGANVLAIQVFAGPSPDGVFVFDAALTATLDEEPPLVEAIEPAPGSWVRALNFIEVQFSEPVWGVDAADLLVNGEPATNVIEVAAGDFLFGLPEPADGRVEVAWRDDHGITDAVDARHPFGGGAWVYTVDRSRPASGVMLSEFMADNRRTLNDEDGESSDWIEVFNSGTEPANLEGWSLTDDRARPDAWRFPEIEVPAGGYLLVFASGKNRTNTTGRLHTNFKLAAGGGYLALVDPGGSVVSDFGLTYPAQRTDVSYGRVAGEGQATGYFTKPTPGALNVSSGPGFAPEVWFTRAGGPFTNAFTLGLATSLGNAVIRYTVDGNLPTNSSPVYTGPIGVSNTVQVRARAFADGLLPGPPRSEGYVLLSSNVFGFKSNLPVLVLHAMGKGAPNASRLSFAHVSVYEPAMGVTALTDRPVLNLRSGVQIRGSSTEGMSKASYKFELWDDFGQDDRRALLGLPADSDWVLYAPNQFEPVLIHNPFVHQLSRDLGRYSPRTRFVEVYFNRGTGPVSSAHYAGIYVLEEKIKIGPDRVAIDELEAENLAPPSITGGYVLKIDRLDPGDGGISAGGVVLAHVDPKERELKLVQRRPQQNYIRDYFNAFSNALKGTNWLHEQLGYRSYFDLEAAIDFHVLEVLSGNVDALVLSTYLHKPRGGKITFGPHWDFDRALGSTDGRDANPRVWATGPFFSAPWWSRIFTDKNAWQRWVDRWQELRETHFALTNLHGLIDRQAGEVRQAQPREYQKWRVTLRGGSYQSEINLMKNWVSNRIDFIDRQLTPPPRLSHAGGSVPSGFTLAITRPTNATVYYTTDGSDPRSASGGIAIQASAYSSPITLQANARVVARAFDATKKQVGGPPAASSTPWSRPAAATFVVTLPPLLITEIMFHPEAPPAGEDGAASDYEFLELKNQGSEPLNLAGFRLTNGVDYVFSGTSAVRQLEPGQRVLLVRNLEAFRRRYPAAGDIAGEYVGGLGNGGNRVTLIGPLGELVSDLTYSDAWAPLADGFGFSLVLADETTAPDALGAAAGWRSSIGVGGSPGAVDPPPPALPTVWVNEVLTHTDPPKQDAIELLNPRRSPADVSGWYLTDDYRTPRKYRIPDGTVIPPRTTLVLTETAFGAPGPGAFALSAGGDEAYLFSADAEGRLTGYAHGFAFGAADPHMSFGLHWLRDGTPVFAEQMAPSLGRANSGLRVGPVVIHEILYDPTPSGAGAEYIELHNPSPVPVPLFDAEHPANTWRLRGGVDLDFPTGLVLLPNGFLLAVGFDPAEDLGRLAAFRAHHHVQGNPRLIGPWKGHLSAAGGVVRLLRPGQGSAAEMASGAVPYVLIEEVHYRPDAPWPASAAGTGRSLARHWESSYADDPANWFASIPGPGFLDRDGDGLPDDWEAENGLSPLSASGADGADGDPDHDGLSNSVAFWTGRPAWFGPSRLTCERSPDHPAEIVFRFDARPGHGYTLVSRDPRGETDWVVERSFPAQSAPQSYSAVFPVAEDQRWFRLLID